MARELRHKSSPQNPEWPLFTQHSGKRVFWSAGHFHSRSNAVNHDTVRGLDRSSIFYSMTELCLTRIEIRLFLPLQATRRKTNHQKFNDIAARFWILLLSLILFSFSSRPFVSFWFIADEKCDRFLYLFRIIWACEIDAIRNRSFGWFCVTVRWRRQKKMFINLLQKTLEIMTIDGWREKDESETRFHRRQGVGRLAVSVAGLFLISISFN
jgi:hypothetical protein